MLFIYKKGKSKINVFTASNTVTYSQAFSFLYPPPSTFSPDSFRVGFLACYPSTRVNDLRVARCWAVTDKVQNIHGI